MKAVAHWVLVGCLAGLALGSRPVMAEGTVTNGSTAALLQGLRGGGQVLLSFTNTLTLETPVVIAANTVIVGNLGTNRPVTLSGGGRYRIFQVLPGISLEVRNCILRDGLSTNGGAILNEGLLTLQDVTIQACKATGPAGTAGAAGEDNFGVGGDGESGTGGTPAAGGGIYNVGIASLLRCTFTTNVATGGDGGAGGARGNGAFRKGRGGNGGQGALGHGGAIANAGTLVVEACEFSSNSADGGDGGVGGSEADIIGAGKGGSGAEGAGGAILSTGSLLVQRSAFASNLATGGKSALPGATFENIGRDGDRGGGAFGGAIASWGGGGLINCTFYTNLLVGGNGANGSIGTFVAGDGGDGGDALGAAVHARGGLGVTNVTFAWNSGTNGAPGTAGNSQFAEDGSAGRLAGSAIASDLGPSPIVINCILASTNISTAYGSIVDAGHNLFTDGGIGAKGPGSIFNTGPVLGEYKVWDQRPPGLMPAFGSLAVDGADPAAAPLVDQRGLERKSGGLAPDIGALESAASGYVIRGQVLRGSVGVAGVQVMIGTLVSTTDVMGSFEFGPLAQGFYTVTLPDGGIGYVPRQHQVALTADTTDLIFSAEAPSIALKVDRESRHGVISGVGEPGGVYQLQRSLNFSTWVTEATVTAGAQGGFTFEINVPESGQSFYQVGWE
ncbi:MAG: hypothetical protein IT581_16390 [Verrucomicrobiales bacterium]|nr:hypothetical protein [Verrucomicrobiales bacterium]